MIATWRRLWQGNGCGEAIMATEQWLQRDDCLRGAEGNSGGLIERVSNLACVRPWNTVSAGGAIVAAGQ